jgi:serine O-acetyltransferase
MSTPSAAAPQRQAYRDLLYQRYLDTAKCVSIERVDRWLQQLLDMIFPISKENLFPDRQAFDQQLQRLETELEEMILCSLQQAHEKAFDYSAAFFQEMPEIIAALDEDIEAIYAGDPAAHSLDEVVRSYPGLKAIAAYRIAHFLHQQGVPIIPRLITESAHSRTGIDIHPAAQIGRAFFIDHGTGIVIGATAVIGHSVKIYQGVTLGGLSVRKEDAHAKRHPTIEAQVVIYAGATILGGDTVIGRGSIIGGNTFITKSVPPGSKVYYSPSAPPAAP